MQKNIPYLKLFTLMVAGFILSGCVSNESKGISRPMADRFVAAQAQQNIATYQGRSVRWGGEIIKVVNKANHTDIEVLQWSLDRHGKPQIDQTPGARFIVQINTFIDPVEYAAGRLVTASGTLTKTTQQKVGEYLYTYPVVQSDKIHLWSKASLKKRHTPIYDPYYDPYYSSWRWRWYRF